MRCTTIPTSFVYGKQEEYRKIVSKYCELGIDTVRVNCTRYSFERYLRHIEALRNSYEYYGMSVRILIDLPFPGEKVRVEFGGKNADFNFMEGENYEFIKDKNRIDGSRFLMFDKESFFDNIDVNESIILGDGEIELLVQEKNKDSILVKSLSTGVLAYRKAAYTNKAFYSKNCSIEKSKEFYQFINDCKPSYVVFSFLEYPEDIAFISDMISQWDRRPLLFAKIETLMGVKNIDSIISKMDGIMIGRGDLGLSCDSKRFVLACDNLYRICQERKIEVIVATDILNSLGGYSSTIPNRAEMMDVYYMQKLGISKFVANSKISSDLNRIAYFDKILQDISMANIISI